MPDRRCVSLFLVFLFLMLEPATFPQRRSTPITLPPIQTRRPPDPSLQHNIEFQTYDKTPLKFSSTTIYVLVPVVVTDKDGKHVSGLVKDNFRLQENGKDRTIASLEEIKPTATPVSPPTHPSNVTTNQTSRDSAPRRITIIAIDMVNTPFSDQARARQAIISYLSNNIELDSLYLLVAVENNGLRVLHDYTGDTSALVAALKTVGSRFATANNVDPAALRGVSTVAGPTTVPSTSVNPDTGNPELDDLQLSAFARAERPYAELMQAAAASSTLLAFQQIAERVSGIPGRKSLIWITGGFPFSIDPGTAAVNQGLSFEAYQHVMQGLSNQMISVYPIDARGLLTLGPDAGVQLTRKQNAQFNGVITDESNRQLDILETMRAFADMTGGHAYVNTNDVRGAVRDAVQDGSAYYMLSYAVDKTDRRPGWRKISVKVADYRVRARHGYFLTQTTIDPLATAQSDIDAALKSPFDYTGLPLKVTLDPPVRSGEKRKVTFAMMMPPKAAEVDSADNNRLHVDIAYAVWTAAGQDAGHKGTSYNLNLNPAQLQQIMINGVGYGDTLELSPGTYKLRVVVRDEVSGRMGSVLAPLTIE